jgi:hypothetical protein
MLRLLQLLLSFFPSSLSSYLPRTDVGSGWDPSGSPQPQSDAGSGWDPGGG